MGKKVVLSFPNCSYISLERLSNISIELQGYYYISQMLENEDSDVIHYYPKPSQFLLYNSFVPIISVKEAAGSSGVVLTIVGKQRRIVRFGLCFFYVVLGLIQCFLIKTYLDGFLETQFAGFIPVIMFAFLFSLSTATESLAIKAFAVKYRVKIEELFSAHERME